MEERTEKNIANGSAKTFLNSYLGEDEASHGAWPTVEFLIDRHTHAHKRSARMRGNRLRPRGCCGNYSMVREIPSPFLGGLR